MIGIKIQNSFWEKALLKLLAEQAEVWQPQKKYQAVLVGLPASELKAFAGIEKAPLIELGKDLPIPFKIEALKKILASFAPAYENADFRWDSVHRQLHNKKTHQVIQLTEKEAGLIDFLATCPQKEATQKELLENVWQYKNDTDTHTIETTLYGLNQKLGKNKIILTTKQGYRLI